MTLRECTLPCQKETLQTLSFCLNTSRCDHNANAKIKSEPRIQITCVCQDVKMHSCISRQPTGRWNTCWCFSLSIGMLCLLPTLQLLLTSLFMFHVLRLMFDIAVKIWVALSKLDNSAIYLFTSHLLVYCFYVSYIYVTFFIFSCLFTLHFQPCVVLCFIIHTQCIYIINIEFTN